MANNDDPSDDVTVLAADQSLLRKLGNINLDKVLSPEAIEKAEAVITDASDGLYVDCLKEADKLESVVDQFKSRALDVEHHLKKIISSSFSIKAKAGQSGYDLVSLLAKSLHVRCEEMLAEQVTPSALKIIAWHAQSIKQLLVLNVKGDGGKVGEAILAEIEKLKFAA
jgi:hypothetical protein